MTQDGIQREGHVKARALHAELKIRRDVVTWIRKRIGDAALIAQALIHAQLVAQLAAASNLLLLV